MAPPLREEDADGSSALRARMRAGTSSKSAELDKLLNTWGAKPGLGGFSSSSNLLTASSDYNAELMIDELLESTWQLPTMPTAPQAATARLSNITSPSSLAKASSQLLNRPGLTATASFRARQKSCMQDLQQVLAESIDKLMKHRQGIAERIQALERDNQKVASKYQESLRNPELLLSQICHRMEDIEERFTKVSSTAMLIGDRLSGLEDERKRVLETDELMEAILALNDPTNKHSKSSNRLFNTLQDKNQLHEASRVIKKMLTFSSELSSPTLATAVSEIERLSQTIESDLLDEFSAAQEQNDDVAMKKCAESLIEYNDKEKVADRYVWNVMKDRLAKESGHQINSLDPILDLESLFVKIRTICKEQFVVIHKVFPPSAYNSIREMLIERLFNDPVFGILSYLEQFLTTRTHAASMAPSDPGSVSSRHATFEDLSASSSINPEYVRLLCAAYEKTCALTAAIEELETVHRPHRHSKDHKDTSRSQGNEDNNNAEDSLERLQTFLSLQLHSLFGSHRQRYFRTELDLFQQNCKQTFAEVKFPTQLTAKQKIAATKAKNSTSTSTSSDKEPIWTPDMGVTFYETLLKLVKDHEVPARYAQMMQATITRCGIVLKNSDMQGELVTKIFSSYCASYADEYLGKLLSMMNELLQEPYLSPDAPRQFFSLAEHFLQRIETLETQFDSYVAPSQEESPTQLTICHESKRKTMEKLESQFTAGLQMVFTAVEKNVTQILVTTQDKNDFIGSEANMSLSCSKACRKCIEYVQPLVALVCQVLLDENRDRFLVGLCVIFKQLFLVHLQKYKFDPDGACMLLRDVNAYRDMFRSFHHPAIDDIFEVLHEIANLFALPPENVGGFVRDSKLAMFNKQSLLELLKRRWDYKTHSDKLVLI